MVRIPYFDIVIPCSIFVIRFFRIFFFDLTRKNQLILALCSDLDLESPELLLVKKVFDAPIIPVELESVF